MTDGVQIAEGEFGSERLAGVWLLHRTRQHHSKNPAGSYRATVSAMVDDKVAGAPTIHAIGAAPEVTSVLAAAVPDLTPLDLDMLDALDTYDHACAEVRSAPVAATLMRSASRERAWNLIGALNGLDQEWARYTVVRLHLSDLEVHTNPGGPFRARIQRITEQENASGTGFIDEKAFDSPRHARSWLILRTLGSDVRTDRDRRFHAEVFDISRAQAWYSVAGTSTEIGMALSSVTEFDGTLITGLFDVDAADLYDLVSQYVATTGWLINAGDYVDDEPAFDEIAIHRSHRDRLGEEIFAMLTEPHLADLSERIRAPLDQADRCLLERPFPIDDDLALSSSGYLEADLELAVRHYLTLTAQAHAVSRSDEKPSAHLAQIIDGLAEVDARIDTLLAHPRLAHLHELVQGHLAEIDRNPDHRPEPLCPWPYPRELINRAMDLDLRPTTPDPAQPSRDIMDALRLRQVMQAVVNGTNFPGLLDFHITERLERALAHQHTTLDKRITEHPLLNCREKQALGELLATLNHHSKLPDTPFEALGPSSNVFAPGDSLPPDARDIGIRYSVTCGEDNYELVLGVEDSTWVARCYAPRRGHPGWFSPKGVATFTNPEQMLDSIAAGTTFHGPRDSRYPLGPVSVPGDVAAKVRTLAADDKTTPRNHEVAASAPTPTVKPRTPEQRRLTQRRQPPPQPRRRGPGL